jgi:hypothetical protein
MSRFVERPPEPQPLQQPPAEQPEHAELANHEKDSQHSDHLADNTSSTIGRATYEHELTNDVMRIVTYVDRDYYELLPDELQYLLDLSFTDGALGYFPPSYKVKSNEK